MEQRAEIISNQRSSVFYVRLDISCILQSAVVLETLLTVIRVILVFGNKQIPAFTQKQQQSNCWTLLISKCPLVFQKDEGMSWSRWHGQQLGNFSPFYSQAKPFHQYYVLPLLLRSPAVVVVSGSSDQSSSSSSQDEVELPDVTSSKGHPRNHQICMSKSFKNYI